MLDGYRTVNYDDLYLEPHQLALGEAFADSLEEHLTTAEREKIVEDVARMVTAGAVMVFDQDVGACYVNCNVYNCDSSGEEKGVLMYTEKTEIGVISDTGWVSAQLLRYNGFTDDEIRAFGFSLGK